ncbi:AAA family ATPase [Streptomyces nigra]|uniref:AAA family ATPase n=1 Tax=Streptomyces nigra TaxID=1827580 RepID=UPI003828A795
MDLLGRETVLQDFTGHLQAATIGPGRMALVLGESGIGKTAVVEHLVQSAGPHIHVLAGACDPLATPRPHGPADGPAPPCLGRTVGTALKETGSNDAS